MKLNTKILKISLIFLMVLCINMGTVEAASGDVINISVNKPYTTNISLPFAPYNTCNVTFPSNPCQIKYGDVFIIDNEKSILFDSGWSEVTVSPYIGTATFTPTVTGTYYLVVVIINQTYTYDTNWTSVEVIETKEAYQLISHASTPIITPPTMNIQNIVDTLLDWIRSLFPSIGW